MLHRSISSEISALRQEMPQARNHRAFTQG
jgi:hypothetical protein